MGAVAAQNDNGGAAGLAHFPGCEQGILNRGRNIHADMVQLREDVFLQIGSALIGPINVAPDAALLRHHQDIGDAAGGKCGENAQHDIGPVGDLKR